MQDSEQVIAELKQQVKAFEFHGYMRSGQGLNSEGGQMVAFQAPGAPAKYRLGNEAETYGEMIFVNNWINPSRDPDKAWMKTEVLVQANTTQAQSYCQHRSVPLPRGVRRSGQRAGVESVGRSSGRANVTTGGSTSTSTTSTFSTPAATAEALRTSNVKIGQMSVAYLGGAKDDLITSNGIYPKSLLDVRLYGMKTPVGQLGRLVRLFVLQGRHARRR